MTHFSFKTALQRFGWGGLVPVLPFPDFFLFSGRHDVSSAPHPSPDGGRAWDLQSGLPLGQWRRT